MEAKFLAYKRSSIAYYTFGKGPKPAICFHGYGEDASSYLFLESHAGDRFTFYTLDLPFHGKTEWKEGLLFTINDLYNICKEIIDQENISRGGLMDKPQTSNLKLTLIGFSLGGRVALSLYQHIPEKIERLVLMAPDGLKLNFWYWLATQNLAGNKLFAFTMKYPGWFFLLLQLLNKLRLVNTSIFKFVRYYIGDRRVRQLLYDRWTSLRRLKPHIRRIKMLIQKYQTPVRLLYGRHDRIILPVRGEKFRSGIEDHCQLFLLESGHQVLQEKHAKQIVSLLTD